MATARRYLKIITEPVEDIEYEKPLVAVILLCSTGLLISSSMYVAELTDKELLDLLKDCTCGAVFNGTCSQAENILASASISETKRSTSDIIEVLKAICTIFDIWGIWMSIGVLCLISSTSSILLISFRLAFGSHVRPVTLIVSYVIPTFIGVILIMLTQAFTSRLEMILPDLANPAIATLAFCLPGLIVMCVIVAVTLLLTYTNILNEPVESQSQVTPAPEPNGCVDSEVTPAPEPNGCVDSEVTQAPEPNGCVDSEVTPAPEPNGCVDSEETHC